VFKRVDTCAAEFATHTAYMYSTYEEECEAARLRRKKIMVLGGGPNRIGQGIEFDYCCVHAALAMREDGYETIMVNCNPETVSTDYDTSDRLYFEPLTLEDVLEIVDVEQPEGVIVQFGGQTPLKLARDLEANGVPIIGTSPDMIDLAEDRERFQQMLHELGLRSRPTAPRAPRRTPCASPPRSAIRWWCARATCWAGAPWRSCMSRRTSSATCATPSRFPTIRRCCSTASSTTPSRWTSMPSPTADRSSSAASWSTSNRPACIRAIPPARCRPTRCPRNSRTSCASRPSQMAMRSRWSGLMNVQFAIQDGTVYMLEVNPRASRTVPFVSKATGCRWPRSRRAAWPAARWPSRASPSEIVPPYYSVKEAVFPFIKFPGVDTILGPEMKSTGEVMGVGETFGEAFVKSQLAGGMPKSGKVFISVKEQDRAKAVEVARDLADLGFTLLATRGTGARSSRPPDSK
jgi:carbamoyl-phosphate synthase large subunit